MAGCLHCCRPVERRNVMAEGHSKGKLRKTAPLAVTRSRQSERTRKRGWESHSPQGDAPVIHCIQPTPNQLWPQLIHGQGQHQGQRKVKSVPKFWVSGSIVHPCHNTMSWSNVTRPDIVLQHKHNLRYLHQKCRGSGREIRFKMNGTRSPVFVSAPKMCQIIRGRFQSHRWRVKMETLYWNTLHNAENVIINAPDSQDYNRVSYQKQKPMKRKNKFQKESRLSSWVVWLSS